MPALGRGELQPIIHRVVQLHFPSVALGEMQTLLVNGNGHVLVLVSIDYDDRLNSADDFATDNGSDFCLLKESASARRVDKTAERLEASCYEVTVPMAVGAVSAISESSRQIIWKASGPVSDRVRPEPGRHRHIIASQRFIRLRGPIFTPPITLRRKPGEDTSTLTHFFTKGRIGFRTAKGKGG